jgi:hypothetical protein
LSSIFGTVVMLKYLVDLFNWVHHM